MDCGNRELKWHTKNSVWQLYEGLSCLDNKHIFFWLIWSLPLENDFEVNILQTQVYIQAVQWKQIHPCVNLTFQTCSFSTVSLYFSNTTGKRVLKAIIQPKIRIWTLWILKKTQKKQKSIVKYPKEAEKCRKSGPFDFCALFQALSNIVWHLS